MSSQWFWVALAWGQLVLFYGGYLFYLRWRQQHLKDGHLEDESSND